MKAFTLIEVIVSLALINRNYFSDIIDNYI